MRLERSKEWWMARAAREGDADVGAGLLAFDPKPDVQASNVVTTTEETRIAFGRFVNLMRRQRGWSIEKLAQEADVDASDLLVIEEDIHHGAEPRTIYRLSEVFDVPQKRLLQLAGLAVANDDGFRQEAVRFAARSESVQKLTREESSALEAFVAVLSEQEPRDE
jgi:HTH-type transcriptional regulator, competence development regulator